MCQTLYFLFNRQRLGNVPSPCSGQLTGVADTAEHHNQCVKALPDDVTQKLLHDTAILS